MYQEIRMTALRFSRDLARAASATMATAAMRAIDRGNGLRTTGNVYLAELGLAHPERVHYNPSSWAILKLVEKAVGFHSDDTFVDFGSGKGRVVAMAARHELKRVVGIEISPQLNAIARENIDRNRNKMKCQDIQLLTSDAITCDVPRDMSIAYFYSPFTGEIFRSVIDRIEASLPLMTSRRLIIVLLRPTGANDPDGLFGANDAFLDSRPWLTLMKRIPYGSMTGWKSEVSMYRAR